MQRPKGNPASFLKSLQKINFNYFKDYYLAYRKTNAETESYLQNLQFLSKAARNLLAPMSKKELFEFIAAELNKLVKDNIVLVNEFDPLNYQTILQAINCSRLDLKTIKQALGKNPIGLKLPFTKTDFSKMMEGLLVKGSPKRFCHSLETALKVRAIYTMPFMVENNLLGTVAILTKTSQPLLHHHLIEAFISLSAVALKRKSIEEQLEASEAKYRELATLKDEFISIASHELKTPLTSLKAYNQLLLQQTPPDSKPFVLLNKMDYQISRLEELVNDLLDAARINEGRLELNKDQFYLDQLIKDTLEELNLLYPNHKFSFKCSVHKKIKADKYRINQVLTNFLSNAVKYSPGKNIIKIKLGLKKDNLIVSVKDFGLGIVKSEQSKIFDLFYRIKNPRYSGIPGMGLGLHICADIIKLHKGNIWVKSQEGKGSTFFFSLPLRHI